MMFSSRKPVQVVGALIIALLAAALSLRITKIERQPPVIGKNNTVLFITNVEHGLSNVHVATVYSLLERHPEIIVHFASWPKIKPKIKRMSVYARIKSPSSRPAIFHQLPTPKSSDACGFNFTPNWIRPPGIPGLKGLNDDMATFVSRWTGEDHLMIHNYVQKLIRDIDPAVVVLDMFHRPGVDATRGGNRLHAILSPNVLADVFGGAQPWLRGFWKFPAFAWAMLFNPELVEKRKFLAGHGLEDPISFFTIHQPGNGVFISQDTAAVAIPLSLVPANVTTTGPIVISVASAAEQDLELTLWLKRAPTVLINLGSLFEYDADRASSMAGALETVLGRTNVQVLWKLNKAPSLDDKDWRPVVEEFITNDRLRVSKWLTVDPTALLETGDIIASVHHGGANCYHEAIATGVPHLILATWLDLYNYAARVEQVGIGIWGNRESAPGFSLNELSDAFLRLVDGGPESVAIRDNARAIQQTLRRPGRDIAADEIARLAARGM
ncbi:hypothetical protein CFIO01_09660 [Colletotrichum fioriniae PJ7]|uniref:Erythromycin biosynthesis protein CIII-like C-terminal domain-containing protein n=1 Tax=Colletotrichum fioriniae PJ7 TaxID=1445577 RepID=A0A010QWF8_9PEZI|nr:hypothetical protein CFIO01_09660 [Colletotrichum fioriniae PJ7]